MVDESAYVDTAKTKNCEGKFTSAFPRTWICFKIYPAILSQPYLNPNKPLVPHAMC
jgi:hypothetical protein